MLARLVHFDLDSKKLRGQVRSRRILIETDIFVGIFWEFSKFEIRQNYFTLKIVKISIFQVGFLRIDFL